MDAVGPHVHVVDLGEVAVHERGMVSLPLLGQPRDRGRGEPGRATQELLQGRHEVALARTREGLVEARRPRGEDHDGLVRIPPSVASETPKPAPTCANVSFFRRCASTGTACLKQFDFLHTERRSRL